MRCLWCGEETPDGSTYCEKCGHVLEDGENAVDPEAIAFADENAELYDVEERAAEETDLDAADFELFDDYSYTPQYSGAVVDEDAIGRMYSDNPYIRPPSPPIQPVLSRGRIAIVGVIAVLFSAAVILLVWATIMRVLGL